MLGQSGIKGLTVVDVDVGPTLGKLHLLAGERKTICFYFSQYRLTQTREAQELRAVRSDQTDQNSMPW